MNDSQDKAEAFNALSAYLHDPATVMLVDQLLSRCLLERAEANHLGTTHGPTVTDMARRVLAAIERDMA